MAILKHGAVGTPFFSEDEGSALKQLEGEVVAIFSNLSRLLGNPPSYGEIYGLLFISERALTMDEIIERLHISKGSASQGLRQLAELGAIRKVKNDGDRSHGYLAEHELKRLITAFLKERFIPHLESGTRRLAHLEKLAPQLPPGAQENVLPRLKKLSTWHTRAMTALPFALKLLQDD